MAFLSFPEIRNIQLSESETRMIKSEASFRNTVFLSHSSKDDLHVEGVRRFLIKLGVNVYVDNGDHRLPINPSPQTAKILRDEIKKADRLIVLVSANSATSGWIPWELGMGDGHKGIGNLALLPITASGTEEIWATREYLGLYPVIKSGEVQNYTGTQWYVQPSPGQPVRFLKDWLTIP